MAPSGSFFGLGRMESTVEGEAAASAFEKCQDWEYRTLVNSHVLYASEASLCVCISQHTHKPQ